MPAPTNISFATATDVGTFPFTVAQRVDFGGTTYRVYYKFTAPAGVSVVGIWAFGDLVVYIPFAQPYDQNQFSVLGLVAVNVPFQFPVTPGQVYYIAVGSNTGNVSPANLTLSGVVDPESVAPVGSFLIPDDTPGFPAAILDGSTGAPLRYIQNFATGEAGDMLPDGTSLFQDINAAPNDLNLYDINLNLLTTVPISAFGSANPSIRGNSQINQFYVGYSGVSHASISIVSKTGTIVQTWTLPAAGLTGVCPSLDGSIVYVTGQNGIRLQQFLTASGTFGADLATGPAGMSAPEDILVMTDGSVITVWDKLTAPRACQLIRYSSTGAVLNSLDIAAFIAPNALLVFHASDDRLAYNYADTSTFWLWVHMDSGFSRFIQFRFADFSVVRSFDAMTFEQGVYQGAATATPAAKLGHSESCPFVLTRVGAALPGTIVVIKQTPSPTSQLFSFVTVNLSPGTFTLASGASQTFANLLAGSGYSVVETPVAGWSTVYVVSNGSPNTNLVVVAGQTTTVTVINTPVAAPGCISDLGTDKGGGTACIEPGLIE